MAETRLKLEQSMLANLIYMAGGNPGSMQALHSLVQSNIDKDTMMLSGLDHLMNLDSAGIYDGDIYILMNDVCKNVTLDAVTILRGMQLGLIDRKLVYDACHRQDRMGAQMIPKQMIEELYQKIKKQLPNFNS